MTNINWTVRIKNKTFWVAIIDAPAERFITQDEVDLELRGGNHYEGGKIRIYEYFQTAHSTKEQAEYLKNSYGIGGHSHACGGADRRS